jgi:very-short-patch-repair endonuclease
MAGLLDLGPQAVVSGRAAAALHQFDGFPEGPADFTVPRSGRSRRSIWTVHTALRIDRIDTATIDEIRCTSASRTILDLARSATKAELARAIDSAVRDGSSSPTFLLRRLSERRGPGHWGVPLIDELLVDAGGHSVLERAFLTLVRRAGLPRPTCQRIPRLDGRRIGRVDFCFEPQLVIVEVAGRRGHSTDPERAKDAQRRNELQAAGYRVLEFTYADIIYRPDFVLATLRQHGL